MFNIVLVEPEIPPNTGNIIRLAANTGSALHLVGPLGFSMDDRQLRRAGLDYHEWANLHLHDDFEAFLLSVNPGHCYGLSTKGKVFYHDVAFQTGDAIVFGPETRGLPQAIREHPRMTHCLRIPMQANSRSLNLSNAAAIVVYEGWRQLGFGGAI